MNLTNLPIISFIIPVYNVEQFLEQCLISIIEQPLEKEIIIIDDGSIDNSLLIALNYAKHYSNIIIVHNSNQGVSAARNKGLQLAKGKYISFIDADDYLVGDLSQIIKKSEELNTDLAIFSAVLVYNPNEVYQPTSPIFADNEIVSGYDILASFSENNTWIPGVCWTLIRKSYIEQHKLFFEEGVIAEDQLFYLQLLTALPNRILINHSDVYYIYRKYNFTSTTYRNDKKYIEDHLRMILLIRKFMNTQPRLIQPYILYTTSFLLKAIVQKTTEWSIEQRLDFPYFYQPEWQAILQQDYPIYWEAIKQLYNIIEN